MHGLLVFRLAGTPKVCCVGTSVPAHTWPGARLQSCGLAAAWWARVLLSTCARQGSRPERGLLRECLPSVLCFSAQADLYSPGKPCRPRCVSRALLAPACVLSVSLPACLARRSRAQSLEYMKPRRRFVRIIRAASPPLTAPRSRSARSGCAPATPVQPRTEASAANSHRRHARNRTRATPRTCGDAVLHSYHTLALLPQRHMCASTAAPCAPHNASAQASYHTSHSTPRTAGTWMGVRSGK
jgi:hypothetical protein